MVSWTSCRAIKSNDQVLSER